MDAQQIESRLRDLAAELQNESVKGEICLYGGAVMCLVYQARPATKDVDAIFEPSTRLRQAARKIAQQHGLPDDWLNDAVKGYVVPHRKRVFFQMPNLVVYVPDAQYLLAMKCLAARFDTSDRDDVIFLVRRLGLRTADEVLNILRQYYPRELVKPATGFFVEEVMQQL